MEKLDNKLLADYASNHIVMVYPAMHKKFLHFEDMKKIYSDIDFVEFIKTNYSNLPIGISTNSFEIYQAYRKEMDIRIVQIALNPLDFKFNESFIKQLYKDNVSIQIRSVLSSGLLSGKYDEESIFTDNMRMRYHDKKNYDNYLKRSQVSSFICIFIWMVFIVGTFFLSVKTFFG